MDREAMQMALDMLNEIADDVYCDQKLEGVITALRQALETEQEPVAHVDHRIHGWPDCFVIRADPPHTSPLYLSLPKREWVGLTADEIWKCNKAKSGSAVEFHICYAHQNLEDFAESIEAKLKEKNT